MKNFIIKWCNNDKKWIKFVLSQKKNFVIKQNFSTENSILMKLFFVFDIILIKFSDFAYSKYAEICKQLYHLLLNIILSFNAMQSYTVAIKIWFFVLKFSRIQFSLHHLKSYSLFEHVKWIVIMSKLLRCWLQKKDLQLNFFNVIRIHFIFHFRSNIFIANIFIAVIFIADIFIAVKIIVLTFVFIAKNISLFMTNQLTNKKQLINVVKKINTNFNNY